MNRCLVSAFLVAIILQGFCFVSAEQQKLQPFFRSLYKKLKAWNRPDIHPLETNGQKTKNAEETEGSWKTSSSLTKQVRKCNGSLDCKKTECCVQMHKNIRVCRRRPTSGNYCVAFLGPVNNKYCPCAAGLRCERRPEDNMTNHNRYICAPIHPPEKEKESI